MEGRMKVCVLTGKQMLEWREYEIPQPGIGELQIKLEYVGVCGSDLHFYQEGQLALNNSIILYYFTHRVLNSFYQILYILIIHEFFF